MIDRRTLIGAAAALPIARPALAQAPAGETPTPWPPAEHIDLWPGRAPGAPATLPILAPSMNGRPGLRELWLRGVAVPTIGVFRPAHPDGRAVLSLPGGGYSFVSIENEGLDVARALTPHGITVFALAYRLPGEGWENRADVPLQDAQRAMRLIRSHAGRLGIDPAKLGIVGFSAGGHLAASLSVGHGDRVYPPVDAADRLSARPAFSGLVYPVTSVRGSPTAPSILLGPDPSAATQARYDTPPRVTAETPPTFIAHALDDRVVPFEQPMAFLTAAQAARVPVEAHFFERGGHGFGGMHSPADAPSRRWTELFALWTGQLGR